MAKKKYTKNRKTDIRTLLKRQGIKLKSKKEIAEKQEELKEKELKIPPHKRKEWQKREEKIKKMDFDIAAKQYTAFSIKIEESVIRQLRAVLALEHRSQKQWLEDQIREYVDKYYVDVINKKQLLD